MFLFSNEDVNRLRNKKGRDEFLSSLKKKCEAFLSHPLLIPDKGIANWSHYYFCPDCSVRLIFDLDSPLDHECPSCHKHYVENDKIDGAWWRLLNTFNEEASYNLGLLYMLTGDIEYAHKALSVIKGYAKYYPEYQTHGDIPYNGPGRLNAQTLDEANFLRNMAYAYDLIEDTISKEDKEYIKERLFRVGMEFLKEHRHSQIHNHEVIASGAIGCLALILEDRESLEFALYKKYGLIYQLEHGVMSDGYWFECSTAYHFYALENFLKYERFARYTEHSHLDHPLYKKMILSVIPLMKEDYSLPLLNDCHLNQGDKDGYNLFEFAYATWKIEELEPILRSEKRNSSEAFLYGLDEVGPMEAKSFSSFSDANGLGTTIIRRNGIYLLLRHGPFGGEHDHYDRLGFALYYKDIPISMDLGTTGYGAYLHYAYYKNTITHNTIAIDGENQAPSRGRRLSFMETEDMSFASAEVKWVENYEMPDSFTIVQWSEDAYKDAYFKRRMIVSGTTVIDIMSAAAPNLASYMDYSLHFHGKRTALKAEPYDGNLASDGPLSLFTDLYIAKGSLHTEYENMGLFISVDTFSTSGNIYAATAYDNPSDRPLSYIIARAEKKNAVFVSLISIDEKKSDIKCNVSFNDVITIEIEKEGKRKEYVINY